jgi:glycosyltransferase involved in cell wall biosynthesis
MPPRISIITPSYNQGQYLEETILSVINQQYPDVEHIIIDGGSNDSTKQVIEKYRSHLSYVVSEPDMGQSDAVNKGFARATGEIIGWINSDDYYAQGAFAILSSAFANPSTQVVAGCSILFEEGRKELKAGPTINCKYDLDYHLRFPNINQPSTFFRRDVMASFMPLNIHLHYLMDRELWLKYLLRYGIKNVAVTDQVLTYFRIHKDSKSVSQDQKFDSDYATMLYHIAKHNNLTDISKLLAEHYNIVKEYLPSFSIYPDKETTLNMLRYFLLKRGGLVYNKKQFDFAKKAFKLLDVPDYKYYPEETKAMERITQIANCINWLHYKVKMKLSIANK